MNQSECWCSAGARLTLWCGAEECWGCKHKKALWAAVVTSFSIALINETISMRGRLAWRDYFILFGFFVSGILCSQIISGKKKGSEVQPLAAVVILCLSVKNAVQDVSYDKGICLQGTAWKPSNEIWSRDLRIVRFSTLPECQQTSVHPVVCDLCHRVSQVSINVDRCGYQKQLTVMSLRKKEKRY